MEESTRNGKDGVEAENNNNPFCIGDRIENESEKGSLSLNSKYPDKPKFLVFSQ